MTPASRGQRDARAQGRGWAGWVSGRGVTTGVAGGVLPAEAVAGAHLVPVTLIIHRREDEDVEDQEAGADGDGHTQGRAVGAEAALRQGEVALILREARGGGDHHTRRGVVWVSVARGAAGQIPHHDTVRFGLNLNILFQSRGENIATKRRSSYKAEDFLSLPSSLRLELEGVSYVEM